VSTGAKEDESSTGRVWAAGVHHVTARSRLARILKLMNRSKFNFQFFFLDRGKTRITETADTESADVGAHLYLGNFISLKGERYLERINTFSTDIIKCILLLHTITVSQMLYC
jgi:hypothetical protein